MPKSRAERARGAVNPDEAGAERRAEGRPPGPRDRRHEPRAQAEAGWRDGPRSAVRRPPGTRKLQVASAAGHDESQAEESRAQDKLAAGRLSENRAWPRRPRRSGPPSCGADREGDLRVPRPRSAEDRRPYDTLMRELQGLEAKHPSSSRRTRRHSGSACGLEPLRAGRTCPSDAVAVQRLRRGGVPCVRPARQEGPRPRGRRIRV